MTKCLILGAGIVGLSTAYELKKKGFDVTVKPKAIQQLRFRR